MICPLCKKNKEFKKSRLINIDGANIPVCYECWQKKKYHDNQNYNRWQQYKQNAVRYEFWAGEEKCKQEFDIHNYFQINYNQNNGKHHLGCNFVQISEYVEINEINPLTKTLKNKIIGKPGNYMVFVNNFYTIITKQQFLKHYEN